MRPGSMPRYRTDNWRPRLLSLVVAGLLLLMQALVLQHQLDLDHHSGHDHCELCLHLSALDHGMSASGQALQASPPSLEVRSEPVVATTIPLNHPYQTRAPPTFS